jgi:excisionase family DNA binding protein
MTEAHGPDEHGASRTAPDVRVWTAEAVRGLGLTTTVETASSILGISRTTAYALAKRGKFPVRLVRVGRRYLVPTAALLGLLVGEQICGQSARDE